MKRIIGLIFLIAGVVAAYYFYGMKPPTNVADALMSYDRYKFANLTQYYLSLGGACLVFLIGLFMNLKK